jgi:uncharacterized membrane protein YeaQ/YmgE (transglycosylase-associated protein family)
MGFPSLTIVADVTLKDVSGLSGTTWLQLSVVLILSVLVHAIAARILMENWSAGRILAAFLVGAVYTVVAVFIILTGALGGPFVFFFVLLIMILVAGAITARIYQCGLGRGVLYNIAVSVLGSIADRAIVGEKGVLAELFKEEAPVAEVAQQFRSPQEAQQAALLRYPQLGQANSPFNTRFLEKHRTMKQNQDPLLSTADWPMILAREVAAELGVP